MPVVSSQMPLLAKPLRYTQQSHAPFWRTTKDEKGSTSMILESGNGGKERILQAGRAGSQVAFRNSAASLNTTLTGIPSGTTKCRSL